MNTTVKVAVAIVAVATVALVTAAGILAAVTVLLAGTHPAPAAASPAAAVTSHRLAPAAPATLAAIRQPAAPQEELLELRGLNVHQLRRRAQEAGIKRAGGIRASKASRAALIEALA
jgi:hypothetical protein